MDDLPRQRAQEALQRSLDAQDNSLACEPDEKPTVDALAG
jgi:hypothetical protein